MGMHIAQKAHKIVLVGGGAVLGGWEGAAPVKSDVGTAQFFALAMGCLDEAQDRGATSELRCRLGTLIYTSCQFR